MKRRTKGRLRFWSELKRRGVPKVMAMYAATAYIVIEASDIILPRLGLPDWTVTLLIILVIVGLPVAFILSWVFDITPQGVVKTGPVDVESPPETDGHKERRKLRLSDVVIGVLIIAVVILAFPKIFNQGKSKIPREIRGKVSIAVMPFNNMTGDSTYTLWQEGLQNLLITSLSNSQEISVRQFETINNALAGKNNVDYAAFPPSLMSKLAQKLEANTVISGSLHKSGNRIRITANIMNAETEEIYKSYELDGHTEDDFFSLADSISMQIRNFLEIRKLNDKYFYVTDDIFTKSAEAYKLFIQGLRCHVQTDYSCAIGYYNKAIQIDSNFVSAMLKLAYCYGDMQQAGLSRLWAYKANEHMDQLPPEMQLMAKAVKAAVDKSPMEQLEYTKQYLQQYPRSISMTYTAGWINYNLERWPQAIEYFEKSLTMLEKYDDYPWSWTYLFLGRAYHFEGDHLKEEKIFDTGRELWPEQSVTFRYWQAICAISRGDSVSAKFYLSEFKKITEMQGWLEGSQLLWYAGIYASAESFEQAEHYYREALSLRPGNEVVKYEFARFLINNDINVEEGMEMITPLVEGNPQHAGYLYVYGVGLYKLGRYQEALETLQKSWDLKPYYDHKHFILINKIEDLIKSS
jgi:TolB-like protein/Tfp pilus assembly protein PilF